MLWRRVIPRVGLVAQFRAPLMVALCAQGRRFQAAPSAQEGERFSGARGTARPASTGRKEATPQQVAITQGLGELRDKPPPGERRARQRKWRDPGRRRGFMRPPPGGNRALTRGRNRPGVNTTSSGRRGRARLALPRRHPQDAADPRPLLSRY
ncbi:hypothetical protein SBRY_30458 [Actinacidiphila bryophytorum]|uniref:Uncharacterized protein n=1 Tax=Actinacidiphila bryophytorum TaxID=1436133 RepID=A0A9W4H113_9ACTN|nr:hypothetical protein SBRY_30458 [Actinacidiphila bryophytorum]